VTITREDYEAMRRRGLAVNPTKEEDRNAGWYVQHTGLRVGVELETLSALELRARVERAIRGCIEDVPAWNRMQTTSEAVRDSWQAYVAAWPRPSMPIRGADPEYDGGRP
jgi:hypothetical protein